eukprot:COSAG05_NODE_4193_length_1628_cov_14.543492_1_plen_104_part_10
MSDGCCGGFTELFVSTSVDTFVIGESTYAIVAGRNDNGVQLIDVSSPSSPLAVGFAIDGDDGFTELGGPNGIDTFVIGESTYAIVAANTDNGVQLMDVSDPWSP